MKTEELNIKDHLNELGLKIKEFKPIVYHDTKHRDALVFQIKDCSFREIEFDDFTIMLQNHIPGKELIGIKIHNISSRKQELKYNKDVIDYIKSIIEKDNQFYNNKEDFLTVINYIYSN